MTLITIQIDGEGLIKAKRWTDGNVTDIEEETQRILAANLEEGLIELSNGNLTKKEREVKR